MSLATSSSVQTLLYLVLMVESDEPGHLLLCPDSLDCERLPRDFLHALDQVQLSQLVSNLKVIQCLSARVLFIFGPPGSGSL
jgi:hypothetical protein